MIYAYAKLTITNPSSMDAYREQAGAALARHGGAVVAASKDLEALDGQPDAGDISAILSFPDREAAFAWINDPELTEVHALRRNAGQSDILLLG
jgi:uncharacterized protein (DUF1330 family)